MSKPDQDTQTPWMNLPVLPIWAVTAIVVSIGTLFAVGYAFWSFASLGDDDNGRGEAAIEFIAQATGITVTTPAENAYFAFDVWQDEFYWMRFDLLPDEARATLANAPDLCVDSDDLTTVGAPTFINAPRDFAWWDPEFALDAIGGRCRVDDATQQTIYIDTGREGVWTVYLEIATLN